MMEMIEVQRRKETTLDIAVENLCRMEKKLEAIKKALPDYRIMGGWGSGAKAFVEKVHSIIDPP
jgi:hypothetical protein